jgi:hypothetical protein
MNPNAPQGVVRTLITETDHLSRMAYAMQDQVLSTRFAALRTELSRLERKFGASPPRPTSNGEIEVVYKRVLDIAAAAVGTEPREEIDQLVRVASRLRAPRPNTLLGMEAARPQIAPRPAPRRDPR